MPYEEDPADPSGKRYAGSAIWQTELIAPLPGGTSDLAVRADIDIPERCITAIFALRRNRDQTLPASHTIEVKFSLPTDFPFGGVQNVPGLLMKNEEQTRGAPLAGLAVKVTSNFFLIGLSAVEADMRRNLQLLKERTWFDMPIVFNNGRRAILTIEKGVSGGHALEEAVKIWGGAEPGQPSDIHFVFRPLQPILPRVRLHPPSEITPTGPMFVSHPVQRNSASEVKPDAVAIDRWMQKVCDNIIAGGGKCLVERP